MMGNRFFRPTAPIAIGLLALLFAVVGCATHGERVAPVQLPGPQAVAVDGVRVTAKPYMAPEAAKQALGFDARGAGLLPVRFVIDNQSEGVVRLRPKQIFLIDRQDNAWPLLTSEQARKRVREHVVTGETFKGAGRPALLGGAAGAVAGFALGVVTGDIAEGVAKGAAVGGAAGAIGGGAGRYQKLEQEIRQDLEQGTLRIQRIAQGDLAYGYLFFPGKDEAQSVQSLRLALEVGGRSQMLELPFNPAGAKGEPTGTK